MFMGRVEICVCTYWWCHFGCGVLLSYLDACIMPCVIDARLALLSFGVVCVCVCFLELEVSMVLCVFVRVQG